MCPKLKWKTKQEVREWIWEKMTAEGIAQFPLPCYGRIPNFIGVEKATQLIQDLPEFKKARFIFSAPDFVLHNIRELVLQNRKQLLVATPHMLEFLILNSNNIPTRMITKAVTIKSMYKFGNKVHLNQISRPLDIFCQGSVALDRTGNRLGKGKGYGDREYHLLKQEGIIDKQTLLITLIHDVQLIDDFSYLMESNDVKMQIALTPSEIIRL